QRLRMARSRSSRNAPWRIDSFNSAIRSERAFQLRASGEKISRSDTSNATAPMATMASACCRFLIFIGPSFTPLKVERELQRRFAPHLIDLHVADFFGMPQLIEH